MSEVAFAQLTTTMETLSYNQQLELLSVLSKLIAQKQSSGVVSSSVHKIEKLNSIVGIIPQNVDISAERAERLSRQ